jgi:hypothetical protein
MQLFHTNHERLFLNSYPISVGKKANTFLPSLLSQNSDQLQLFLELILEL